MKIAILSDSHDHIANTEKAVEQAQQMGAGALIYCGDFCSSKPAAVVAKFKGPVYYVFGNHDGDPLRIVQHGQAANSEFRHFHEGGGIFELAGKKIALTHYPLYGDALARTGDYDLVCFGHDHEPRVIAHGKCLAVNPGSLIGDKKPASFAIYDAETHQAQLISL